MGSEMCIRDSYTGDESPQLGFHCSPVNDFRAVDRTVIVSFQKNTPQNCSSLHKLRYHCYYDTLLQHGLELKQQIVTLVRFDKGNHTRQGS